MGQLESGRMIMDEKKVVAKEKELEGKTYFTTGDGGILKEIRVPVCDICGRGSEKFNACTICGKKLCEECSISFHSRVYCIDCLNEEIPLSKQEYKVLNAISNDINLSVIADLARMKRDEARECGESLFHKGLIEKKGFLLFSEIRALDKALEVMAAYRQVYGNEEDVVDFETELRRFLDEED